MQKQDISALEALEYSDQSKFALIDVRSEDEFEFGNIPNFLNMPILLNDEHHQVGLCYHQNGQDAAMTLGQQLVAPSKAQRIAAWRAAVQQSPAQQGIVCCWRGGLRSQLAVNAIRETAAEAWQVRGGYKAMRSTLLAILDQPPELLVLGGYTGSGKTKLLQELPASIAVDLEAFAGHRGSSFGHHDDIPQPRTATFENRLAMSILRRPKKILVEGESRAIGRVYIPKHFNEVLQQSPLIFLEASQGERIKNIYEEYIVEPLKSGKTLEFVKARAKQGVGQISRKLGGALTNDLLQLVDHAFIESGEQQVTDVALHAQWISVLLSQYYDKTYQHSMERLNRPIVFRGDKEQCRHWILRQFA